MRKHPAVKRLLAILSIISMFILNCVPAMADTVSGNPDPTEYAHIYSCQLDENGQIVITGSMEGTPDTVYYNDHLYLFELKPYEDSIGYRKDYCARSGKDANFSFSVSADMGTANDKLYSKFVVALFDGQNYVQSSNQAYVTNPEAAAKNTQAYKSAINKKGLLIQTTDSMVTDAFELGVTHVVVNIPFEQLFGDGVDYTYDGVTYHFNKGLLDNYDDVIRRLSEKGMNVTAIILNGWNPATPQLYFPGLTQHSTAQYYAFNATTKEGCDTIKAVATFLASRYSSLDSPYGKVSNWVIGNEVNNQYWNYSGAMSTEQYVKEFERAFRVFYTAIKSVNKSDRVFFSTDYYWNHAQGDPMLQCTAREFIDTFAESVRSSGDIDWGLAYHPYSVPLTEPEFWDDTATGLVNDTVNSPIVNLCNLSVLTDYMQTAPMRYSADNSVRHIILSEQGFTSTSETRGTVEDIQAAAIAYAYYIIDSNPYIDSFIMSRQVDAPIEAAASETFGLWHCDMNNPYDIVPTSKKPSWEVFKYIDNRSRTLETTEFAKSIIGIDKWSDVIPNFKWKSQEK